MSITVTEKFESRDVVRGSNPSAQLNFVVAGTDDHDLALIELATVAPTVFDSLPRLNYGVEPIAETLWLGFVRYGYQTIQQTGSTVYQFDTGGGTQHITQSLATVSRYGRPGFTAPNFFGAIGVTGGSVDGVDITVPVYSFSEVIYMDDSDVTDAYKATLFALTGRVNNAAWRNYAAGEVLFLGASGSKRGSDDWELSFRFAASPNMTGLTIGDITGIAKQGWHYLWVQYIDQEDTTAKSLVKRPLSVHIEQVYPYGNFALLGV
ncbi:MAG TPA: hypothetical protein PK052_04910 [Anaerohalosphaeraceae bacterium]|nr:hypothetical protein [Anaerohalosphaeraceae bacterium]HOL31302.1 hypothetical protein [Anaerohalosphaeraceae bacterium]HOM76964.1 hypothetical protein [Anaerohalosphaeraceae bacterium]HPC64756.1 hypothetical protein [Anaerohalosphaeraceae bacterium]HRS71808.1 hypothetical protein [Anaerohalosphaeraceae bacterium]